jgi:hypothetical protein
MVSREKRHVSPLFQLLVFCVAWLPLCAFLYLALHTFRVHDAQPELRVNNHSTAKHSVKMGLYINDFEQFDLAKQTLVFNGIVWAEFDPTVLSFDLVKQFSFEKGKIIDKGEPSIETRGTVTFARWPLRVKLHVNFNYRAFPLDNHVLFIVLENNKLIAPEVMLVSDTSCFEVAQGARLVNWEIVNERVENGHACVQLQDNSLEKQICSPRILFSISCKKHDLRHLLSILLPLLLIFFLTLFSFSFDVEKWFDTLISISMGGITALLAYRFVIESLSPDVGYFMLSDYLFILFLVAVFAVFFFNTTILHLPARTKKIAICLLHAFTVCGCGLLFYWTLGI